MAELDLKIVNGRLDTTTGVFPVDIGVKEEVLVRGKAVVDDGQIVGEAGYGEYRTPQKAAKQ